MSEKRAELQSYFIKLLGGLDKIEYEENGQVCHI